MSTRRPFSTLLPIIGAAVVTAGAVLFQMARRPAGETAAHARPLARPTPRPLVPHGSLVSGNGEPNTAEEESLLKRLRERGL
jgi:hypothetical protein